jgi:hypothetical protein
MLSVIFMSEHRKQLNKQHVSHPRNQTMYCTATADLFILRIPNYRLYEQMTFMGN